MAPPAKAGAMAQGVIGHCGTGLQDWHSSLCRSTPLGAGTSSAGIEGEVDGTAVRKTAREEQQERRQ